MVGDHVQHNAYFIDFPANVPDTLEFWAVLLREALLDPVAAARVLPPTIDLLKLPGYGRYRHAYADLLAAHAELIPLAGDRVTVLELGGSLESEARELYFSLAGSEVPPAAEDLAASRPPCRRAVPPTNGSAHYSGDLTEAPGPHGATEFIDIRLGKATQPIIVPQVNVYDGERFDEAAEAFFGYMTRDAAQKGRPFEPRTVRMKSDLRGSGRVALPLVFLRGDDGGWRVKWLHLYLKGHPGFNQVEGNRVTASLLVRSIVERDHLRVRYLVDLLRARASSAEHTTYSGLEAPADLPRGARVYTPGTLHELIPA
ncbi:hypothetical protein [Microtetraspora glauca]|uniref:Uncharacterized protein n=1 Tax=Microtetraspora glauca TaxID=1996 RepID=A0ABV3G9T3_MICGL